MAYSKLDTSVSQNDVFYMSTSKESFPYKMYMNMRQEFWENQKNVRKKPSENNVRVFNVYSDKDSVIYNYSSLETSKGLENNSESSMTLNINNDQIDKPETANLFNTSENNEDTNPDFNSKMTLRDTTSHAIPVSVDMSTQFNSDMKIIIEQDLQDKSIINIKFGGTFTGSLVGTGSIPHDTLLSFLNESRNDKLRNENNLPKSALKSTEDPSKVIKVKSAKSKSRPSLGSEDSVGYFASTKPVEPLITKPHPPIKNQLSQDMITTPGLLLSQANSDAKSMNSYIRSNLSSTSGGGKYHEPFTDDPSDLNRMPSISHYSNSKILSTTPAVLPMCIVKRIVRAMLIDILTPKTKVHKPIKLELKVQELTNDPRILGLNWHAAIKRGKIMIGELIELILSVNIDNTNRSSDGFQQVMLELKSEFISCCVYISDLTDVSNVKDHICLEIMIDLMLNEINRLNELFNEWIKTGMKTDFSSYFFSDFTTTISPNASELVTSTEADTTTSTEKSFSKTDHTKSTETTRIPVINKGPSREKRRQKSDSILSEDNNRSSKAKAPNLNTDRTVNTQILSSDPSIITNSRVKRTMNGISQSIVEQNIINKILPKELRNEITLLDIVDNQIVLKRNNQTSLIQELNNQTELWKKPISVGKNSIQDLIEFIINTIAYDKESSKELYEEIAIELERLEQELLVSVATNLHTCRLSNDDLRSLCYEILAEIILDEIAKAKYMFNTLDNDGVDPTMLGKLYRNYTSENPRINENYKSHAVTTDNYAHLTSEIMNYNEAAGNLIGPEKGQLNRLDYIQMNVSGKGTTIKNKNTESLPSRKETLKEGFKRSESRRKSTDSLSVEKERIKGIQKSQANVASEPSSVVLVETPEFYYSSQSDTTVQVDKTKDQKSSSLEQIPPVKSNNCYEKNKQILSPDDINMVNGNSQLLHILNKLNNQTNEINRIKESLQVLSSNVDEKLSSWNCKFTSLQIEKQLVDIPEKPNLVKYGKSTNLYNTQEVIPPSVDLLTNLQPMEHKSQVEFDLRANKIDNKSFIAPISSQTIEHVVKTPDVNIRPNLLGRSLDFDVLKLIGDGAHNFLTSRQIRVNQPIFLQRKDSCTSFYSEFDKIFEWIIEKYQENIGNMMVNSASKTIVEAMKTAPIEEKRKIERELINRIIEQNNLSINNWVKDICFHRILDCL